MMEGHGDNSIEFRAGGEVPMTEEDLRRAEQMARGEIGTNIIVEGDEQTGVVELLPREVESLERANLDSMTAQLEKNLGGSVRKGTDRDTGNEEMDNRMAA